MSFVDGELPVKNFEKFYVEHLENEQTALFPGPFAISLFFFVVFYDFIEKYLSSIRLERKIDNIISILSIFIFFFLTDKNRPNRGVLATYTIRSQLQHCTRGRDSVGL